MKVRNGFVSNSSSSSFVVYGRNPSNLMKELPGDLYKEVREGWAEESVIVVTLPFKDVELDFGWQFERYYGIKNRLNFVVAMLRSMNEEERYDYNEMLRKVLKKYIPLKKYLRIQYDYNCFFWDSISETLLSIDHQSSWGEGSNRDLFENEKNLEDFIFNEDSFIQCGNDNEDETPEWLEALKLRKKSLVCVEHQDTLEGEKK